MHFNVRAQPDLRYVFQFDGEIGSSPQVLQSEESFQRVQRSLNHYDSKDGEFRNQRLNTLQRTSKNGFEDPKQEEDNFFKSICSRWKLAEML